jgi:hypothetical protein
MLSFSLSLNNHEAGYLTGIGTDAQVFSFNGKPQASANPMQN